MFRRCSGKVSGAWGTCLKDCWVGVWDILGAFGNEVLGTCFEVCSEAFGRFGGVVFMSGKH